MKKKKVFIIYSNGEKEEFERVKVTPDKRGFWITEGDDSVKFFVPLYNINRITIID